MGTNYLKKYYLNDGKLAQRARLEFFRSLSTGRMIAFLGSMGTQAFGYGSWEQLRLTFTALALDVARRSSDDKLIEYIYRFHANSVDGNWDPQVGMSLIEEVLDAMKADLAKLKGKGFKAGQSTQDWPLDHFATITQAMRAAVADRFRRPRHNWRIDRRALGVSAPFASAYDVPTALWEKLGIRRFATPSYDFELERVAMLGDHDSLGRNGKRTSPFDQLTQLRSKENENFSWDLGSGRIRRTFPDGWAIESDLMNRERIDRLVEFAVGTDDVNAHIMHVHGRACTPSSMIITQRDYDQLYRRDDLNRRPFELAKRVMMGGNPILFVGLGMSEADLNRDLQEFVSNNPYQRAAPTFLLWSTRTGRGLDEKKREAKRIDFLRRLGILTIFDSDLLEQGDGAHKWETAPFPYMSDSRRADQDAGAQKARKDKLSEELKKTPRTDQATRQKIKAAQKKQRAFRSDGFDALGEAALEKDWTWEWADSAWKEDLGDLHRCVTALDKASLGNASSDEALSAGSLSPTYLDPTLRERHIGSHWRSMEGLFTVPQDQRQEPTVLWQVGYSGASEPVPAWLGDLARKCDRELICIIGAQGCGKGRAARQLMTHGHSVLGGVSQGRTLLINGCFSFDSDSLLDGVARFLANAFEREINRSDERPKMSRATLLDSMELGKSDLFGKRALVVLNGSERFFDLAGEPLSAELDQLLSNITGGPQHKLPRKAKVQWVLFGTERVREYMTRLGARIVEFDECCPDSRENLERRVIPSFYLDEVWRSVQRERRSAESTTDEALRDRRAELPPALRAEVERYIGNSSGRISGDGIDLRRAVYGALFDEATMRRLLNSDSNAVRTARNLMKALAFTGLPTEEDVLRLLPGLDCADFATTLKALVDAKLILEARGYRSAYGLGPPRYTLHRSLLTELRYRYGIPLSEAKLSTAFNMSLYVAQPIDGDIPDHDIHEELGAAVDDLIGGYRHKIECASPSRPPFEVISEKLGRKDDEELRDKYNRLLNKAGWKCGSSRYPVDDDDKRAEIERLCGERHARALRTAIALIRSYYSTTGLLTLDSGDRLIREGRDGVLLEHAERLDDLIDAYGKSAIARETMREGLRELVKPAEPSEAPGPSPDEIFNEAFKMCEPFYPDELVWLHNERGVVRLAMATCTRPAAPSTRRCKSTASASRPASGNITGEGSG